MFKLPRNFPWKQTPLIIIGFFISLIIGPFIDEKGANDGSSHKWPSRRNQGWDLWSHGRYQSFFCADYSRALQVGIMGVLGNDYPYNQEVVIRELAAKINCHILARANERELDDRKHYGKMREGLMRRESRP
jgi:hypothetical protein